MEKESYAELRFHRHLKHNPGEVLRGFILEKSEEKLYGYLDLLQDEINAGLSFKENIDVVSYRQIGRIDVVFRFRSKEYCGEIKYYPYSSGEFWDAIKVVGYTTYYNMCKKQEKFYHPAILMPMDKITVENMMIANKLKIAIFGITVSGDGYKMRLVDDSVNIDYYKHKTIFTPKRWKIKESASLPLKIAPKCPVVARSAVEPTTFSYE